MRFLVKDYFERKTNVHYPSPLMPNLTVASLVFSTLSIADERPVPHIFHSTSRSVVGNRRTILLSCSQVCGVHPTTVQVVVTKWESFLHLAWTGTVYNAVRMGQRFTMLLGLQLRIWALRSHFPAWRKKCVHFCIDSSDVSFIRDR